jgi:transglutaminase-like putative cysteine protease
MTGKDRLSLVAVLAVLASGLALTPLTRDRTYLMLAGFLLLTSAGVGALARRLVRSEAAVRALQAAPVVLIAWLVPETMHPVTLTFDTVAYIQQASAPMPYQTGFAVFCVLLLLILYLVTESMVNGHDAPAWTFVPLFTPFLITAAFGYFEANALLFALPAAAYGLMLATHARSRIVDGPDADGYQAFATQSWRKGIGRAGAVATIGAIVLTMLVGLTLPENTHQAAPKAGPGGVRFNDPSLDLIRNLNSPNDQPVLSYKTSSPNGVLLRLAALPIADEDGFHPVQPEYADLPLDSESAVKSSNMVSTSVSVTDFSSEYLPVPWVPEDVDVRGAWKWDTQSLAVIATGSNSDTATRDLKYQVTSAEAPALEQVENRTGETRQDPSASVLAIPNGLSPEAYDLVKRLRGSRVSAGEIALAIRNYLRSDLFTYSTETAPGTTIETLNDFLFGSRTGYCEQFAGAMAVLARIAGIPSRVVVGFRPGTKTGDTWQVTPHDMHAWAELYFDGLGWLAVDATPPSVFGVQPTVSRTPTPSATRTVAEPTVRPSSAPTHESPTAAPVTTGGTDAFGIAGLVAVGLLVVGAAPGLVRRLQRLVRLRGRGPQPLEDAWDEVRATARDRGAPWPPGSTRAVAAAVATQLDEPASTEFTALALAVEKERYAPATDAVDDAEVPAAARVAVVRTDIERRWPRRRLVDLWWPPSLWPRGR